MNQHNELARRSAIARILADRGDMLVVTGLGSPTYDCAAVGDHPLNFYLWGAMGSAVTVGLGLALAQPKRRVLVITGDGEMLMGLGALATAAVKRPDNLAILVIDNEHYGETGMQCTHTSTAVDLAGVARSCCRRGTEHSLSRASARLCSEHRLPEARDSSADICSKRNWPPMRNVAWR